MPITIQVPGSKSIQNRILAICHLCEQKVRLNNTINCEDTAYMIKGIKALQSKKPKIKISTGNAGTATRFLCALSTLSNKTIILDGNKRMRQRPIAPLIKALNKLGANITSQTSCPPLQILPQRPTGGKITLPGNISSQYLSAILMIAPFLKEKTTITIKNSLCSKPYVKLTIDILKQFGLHVTNKNFEQLTINPSQTPRPPKSYTIESDASSASYFGAFAALNPKKTIYLKNIHSHSIQGDIKFLQHLKKIGCTVTPTSTGTKIKGPKTLKSLKTIDMNETPDLVMTFAILAALTKGRTRITNISNLRIKETDRIQALETELRRIGIHVKTSKSYIEITGNPDLALTRSTKIRTYDDHRIAMAFGILTSRFPNLKIENPACVAKSYPTFWKDLKKAIIAQ